MIYIYDRIDCLGSNVSHYLKAIEQKLVSLGWWVGNPVNTSTS